MTADLGMGLAFPSELDDAIAACFCTLSLGEGGASSQGDFAYLNASLDRVCMGNTLMEVAESNRNFGRSMLQFSELVNEAFSSSTGLVSRAKQSSSIVHRRVMNSGVFICS